MDIHNLSHGICFDNGMSGNCGLECEAFTNGDCDVAEELLDNNDHQLDQLLIDEYGLITFKAMQHQGVDENKLLLKLYGYDDE